VFSIIYADPPWRFKNWSMKELAVRGEKWARANGQSPYDVLDTSAICDLPVKDIAARDAVLFLWATYPKLEDAFSVIKAWDFTFKTVAFTWVKQNPKGVGWKFGLGYWTRGNAEICLLATRGRPRRVDGSVAQLVVAPVGRHSAKPPEVRDRIVLLMGDLPRIELFARPPVPEDWVALGNEITGNDIREDLQRIITTSLECSLIGLPADTTD